MRRLCGRPGCSAAATVTFTFDATRCVVWLDPIAEGTARAGDLCTRHADGLVPPQGWQRVDRRPQPASAEPLAEEPAPPAAADDVLPRRDAVKRRRRRRWTEVPASLFDPAPASPGPLPEVLVSAPAGATTTLTQPAPAVSEPVIAPDAPLLAIDDTPAPAAPEPPAMPAWAPRFDEDDDVDGLLDVQ